MILRLLDGVSDIWGFLKDGPLFKAITLMSFVACIVFSILAVISIFMAGGEGAIGHLNNALKYGAPFLIMSIVKLIVFLSPLN